MMRHIFAATAALTNRAHTVPGHPSPIALVDHSPREPIAEYLATYTVTIGRNIGKTPMASESWRRYCERTTAIMATYSETIYFVGKGSGGWQGTREQSFTIIASVSARQARAMQDELAELAITYSQDAIAIVKGHTAYVGR